MVLGTERYPLAVTLLVAVLLPTAALLLAACPVDIQCSDLRPDARLCLGAEEHRAGVFVSGLRGVLPQNRYFRELTMLLARQCEHAE
jgi:hypothetical protein